MAIHRRTSARLGAVASAVVASLAVWVGAELILGVDLRTPAPGGAGETQDVNAVAVVIPSLLASTAGWGLLVLLERLVTRAGRVWTVVAVIVLVVSLGAPLSASGITNANKGWLVAMHLAVGAALIPLLARTAPERPGRGLAQGTAHASEVETG